MHALQMHARGRKHAGSPRNIAHLFQIDCKHRAHRPGGRDLEIWGVDIPPAILINIHEAPILQYRRPHKYWSLCRG